MLRRDANQMLFISDYVAKFVSRPTEFIAKNVYPNRCYGRHVSCSAKGRIRVELGASASAITLDSDEVLPLCVAQMTEGLYWRSGSQRNPDQTLLGCFRGSHGQLTSDVATPVVGNHYCVTDKGRQTAAPETDAATVCPV
jgi:hypothetical protein